MRRCVVVDFGFSSALKLNFGWQDTEARLIHKSEWTGWMDRRVGTAVRGLFWTTVDTEPGVWIDWVVDRRVAWMFM